MSLKSKLKLQSKQTLLKKKLILLKKSYSHALPLKSPKFKRLPPWARRKKVILPLLALTITLIIGLSFYIFQDLPSPTRLKGQSFPVSTIIMDRNGQVLYEIYADRNRTPIDLDDLPAYVSQAHLAIEDKSFYSHAGFSLQGITRAIRNNLFGDRLEGGSTITQQLVKTALLTPERTVRRKVREAFLTLATELIYTKHDILEMYLNHIPYGGTAWGIESAAKTYFGKGARDLSLAEAALLAGLPQAPTYYSPFTNPERAQGRQQEVLRRMVEDGYISQKQADAAKAESLNFATGSIPIKAPHFALYVKDLLTEKYGQQLVERGGLRVTTSLDLDLQQAAEASLSAEIEPLAKYRVSNAAALVTKPATGEILAMVGSKNYFDQSIDGQVNVTLRLRQPGSSIKPLNYVTAFESKLATPATMVLDIPTCFHTAGLPKYCPKNYDNTFHGPVQLRFSLGNSYNIPAVKVLAINSIEKFISTATAMGITTFTDPSNYGLSLTLGGGEVRMIDMAVAFGSLANLGVRVDLHPILKVTDWQGNVLEEFHQSDAQTAVSNLNSASDSASLEPETTPEDYSIKLDLNPYKDLGKIFSKDQPPPPPPLAVRVLHKAPAYLISHILLDNNARSSAFGPSSLLNIRNQVVSVKTGTTNNLRDNWTIGYTPEFLTAVWVGNNDNTPMNPYLVSGVTGAAPIWHDIMAFALRDQEPLWPEKPADVISRTVCTSTGLVSHPDSPCDTRNEFFWEGTQPGTFSQISKEIWVKADTGFIPAEGDTDNLKLEAHTVLSDPFEPEYCLDCARPLDEQGKPVAPPTIVNMPFIYNPPGTTDNPPQ